MTTKHHVAKPAKSACLPKISISVHKKKTHMPLVKNEKHLLGKIPKYQGSHCGKMLAKMTLNETI
jgi:hypothetical protein